MKFSVWPSSERSWDETLALATVAEAQGWHGFWYADHLMPNTEDGSPDDGTTHEGWTMLAALAPVTKRLRLGSLVSPVTLHHPVVLAKRAVAVDHISHGRAVLGLGAGWQINEHRTSGIELPAVGERVTRFEEAIEIVHRMMREQRVTTTGTYFTATDLPGSPRPETDPLPIVVGTSSPRMSRITAQWADEWNTWGDPATVAERVAVFDKACETVGRDPKSIWRSAQAMLFIARDDEHAAKLRGIVPAGRSLVGSAAQLTEQIAAYVDLGVDEFIVPDFTLGNSPEERAAAFDRIWTEVLAPLR